MSAKETHLQMIEAVINRLSQNSFLLKGWSVVLVSGLFALSGKQCNPLFAALAYFPAISFWLLDAYFLWQERLFRKHYDKVRMQEEASILFSMDTKEYRKGVLWEHAAWSGTICAFHGVVILSITIVWIILARAV